MLPSVLLSRSRAFLAGAELNLFVGSSFYFSTAKWLQSKHFQHRNIWQFSYYRYLLNQRTSQSLKTDLNPKLWCSQPLPNNRLEAAPRCSSCPAHWQLSLKPECNRNENKSTTAAVNHEATVTAASPCSSCPAPFPIICILMRWYSPVHVWPWQWLWTVKHPHSCSPPLSAVLRYKNIHPVPCYNKTKRKLKFVKPK